MDKLKNQICKGRSIVIYDQEKKINIWIMFMSITSFLNGEWQFNLNLTEPTRSRGPLQFQILLVSVRTVLSSQIVYMTKVSNIKKFMLNNMSPAK